MTTANMLISVNNQGIPIMGNRNTGQWIPSLNDGKWGLGTFYLDDVPLGEPISFFLEEDSVGKQFCAQQYEIVENTEKKGKIHFWGKDEKLSLHIYASISASSPAIIFEYELDPIHPIYHRVFISIPFYTSEAVFMKYPYEDTLFGKEGKRWCIDTDISRAPVILGCEKLNGQEVYLSAGYHLEDEFYAAHVEIDSQNTPEAPFRLYSPFKGMARALDLQCITELELLRVELTKEKEESIKNFRFLVSMGHSQYECLKGYIDNCGYNKDTSIRYPIHRAVEMLMDMYKNAPGYIPGKGYTQLIRTDTGRYDTTVPHGWYSKYICPGPQVQLGYELYRYWCRHREETWARERAFEMADFLVSQQLSSGQYTIYNTDMGTLYQSNSEDMQSEELFGFYYNIGDMNLGAHHLYMLYDEVLKTEGIDKREWKEAAQKCILFAVNMTEEDGSLGRNYNINGKCDKYAPAISEALLAMDYMYADTGDEKIHNTQLRIEKWLYQNFVHTNNWADGCMDGGAWVGGGKPPKNNDAIGIMGFMCYCAQMHIRTGEERYLQMAKDAFAYQWAAVIPVQIPGFTHETRGLVREQDFYSAYVLPMRINDYVDCLPYLSKVTGDPLFMQFFRIILQTEMDYQEKNFDYKGIHIGLECSYEGREPIDKLGERNSVYIIRFAALFLKAVNSPLNLMYVGGPDWGIGLDYNLPFNPCIGKDMPYILSCTGMVRNLTWDPDNKIIHIWTYDTENDSTTLELVWNSCPFPVENAKIITSDGEWPAAELYQNESDTLTIVSSNTSAPSKMIELLLDSRTLLNN